MVERPLHAVVLPSTEAGGRLLELLAVALDGTGPAVLPLDPDLPPERLAAILDTFVPAAVHTADGVIQRPEAQPAGPDTAVVIATSGSTGPPKGVELSAAALRHSAQATLDRVGASPGQRWLLCLPATHIAGIQVLVRSLVAGTDPVVVPRADAEVLAGSGCGHVSIVPTQLRRLLDADPDAGWARGFTSVLLGGAAAPAALVDTARAAGVPVLTTYGMSETCGGCVYDGRPLAGVTVATGDAATDGGRIRITGPVLFSGYRERPDLTAAAMDGAWFVTSDLGALGPDGRLTVRGRADDVIITGGEKVVAGEVASLLETCPGVREAVVVGRPDPEWGERVTAVIVPDNPAQPPTLDLLCRHVRERLPRYALPRELVLRGTLPMLPSGKPDLETLRREQSPAGNVSR
ncbi:MAG TPA: AMP-binding protein [Streptosporangiaceae bacterium]|nr:AMP-binding protein [Streptosporangiaceae bacterium]